MSKGKRRLAERVLITGSTGFVGSHLTAQLSGGDYELHLLTRTADPAMAAVGRVHPRVVSAATDFADLMADKDTVIHLAGLAHQAVAVDAQHNPYHEVNVELTAKLAEQAACAGVKRFIFISSIKAQAEFSLPGHPLSEEDEARPEDAYGRSKFQAEQLLQTLCDNSAMEYVIIRPPLVYGPGVKANFLRVYNWISSGKPLPVGALDNRRSLVSVYNLIDFIELCIHHPAAANQLFLVSDGEAVSTLELAKRIRCVSAGRAVFPPLPRVWLNLAARLLGRSAAMQRLCGDLQLDISKSHNLLGWRPKVSMHSTLQLMAAESDGRGKKK